MRKNTLSRRAVLAAGLLIGGVMACGQASANDKTFVIGVAMPFQTNSWQKGFFASAKYAAEQLNASGKKVELKIVDAGGDAQTQIQQINNLTLQGVDFIIIEPLSDTALNGAVDNAVAAGIPVLATGTGGITNPKAIELQNDFKTLGDKYVKLITDRVGTKGTAIMIRGLAGNAAEQTIQDSYTRALAKYPDIKVVSTVYGDWNQSVAQQHVTTILPTLPPKVDIIFSQGEAAFGAAQAFLAAGREVPMQVYGFSGTDVNLLIKLNEKSGYDSVAMNTDPGVGGMAVNVAVAKLSGEPVPMTMEAPVPVLSVAQLKADHGNLADSDILWLKYSYDWTLKNIIGKK
ncbi:conserved exported hypothetical protein [Mesorhizobium plurifarium]|uniref:Periplasmic binding protein domain-containing protein n=1 Tax=Mesorhizobium plurifarium TaxID=69974 RepID=A0A090GKH4_MESPL|nr:conserved exported hypothetical protein [Mesorhizobium sp. SOD10]CDX35434.1 conserved exported hypothetical protein [Mesorhizobium plurifarium]